MKDLLRTVFIWFTGIFVLVIFFPITFLIWFISLSFDRNRRMIHKLLSLQCRLILALSPSWDLVIKGKENVDKNETYVIISNHLSLIDILVINTLGLRFRWVSKIENTRVPVLGWYLRMAGYLTVDREDNDSKADMLARALYLLNHGTSIMLFPEGTRSPDNKPGYFKRGAFQLALSSNVPLLPVVLDGTAEILPKHGRIIRGYHKIRLSILKPVPPSDFGTSVPEELAAKFRSMITLELEKVRKEN